MDKIELVRYIARLSAIKLTPEEEEKFSKQFAKIIEYFNTLNELELGEVEPVFSALPLKNVMRNDKVVSRNPEKIMKNAPDEEENYFKVPKTI